MAPRAKLTPELAASFLELMSEGHTVAAAAKSIGVSRQALYERRRDDAEFAAAWVSAYDAGTEIREQEARRRAVEGVAKPVYQMGKQVGSVTEYSDSLLIFLLKARRPEVYRERVSIDAKAKVETRTAPALDLTKLSDEELEELERITRKAQTEDARDPTA